MESRAAAEPRALLSEIGKLVPDKQALLQIRVGQPQGRARHGLGPAGCGLRRRFGGVRLRGGTNALRKLIEAARCAREPGRVLIGADQQRPLQR